jgi:hypothetical protein
LNHAPGEKNHNTGLRNGTKFGNWEIFFRICKKTGIYLDLMRITHKMFRQENTKNLKKTQK